MLLALIVGRLTLRRCASERASMMDQPTARALTDYWCTQRALYRGWAPRSGASHIVACHTFRRGVDFGDMATRFSHFKPRALALFSTLANIASYYGGIKPARSMAMSDTRANGRLVIETCVDDEGQRPVAYRVFVEADAPLSVVVVDQMRSAANPEAERIRQRTQKLAEQGRKKRNDRQRARASAPAPAATPMTAAEDEASVSAAAPSSVDAVWTPEGGVQKRRRNSSTGGGGDDDDDEGGSRSKRRRREHDDDASGMEDDRVDELLAIVDDEEENARRLGTSSDVACMLMRGFAVHDSECSFVDQRFGKLNKTQIKDIFGAGAEPRIPPRYNFLRPTSATQFCRSHAVPNASWRIGPLGPDADETVCSEYRAASFTMADALADTPLLLPPIYRDALSYYDDTVLSGDGYADTLASPGAPAPVRFPHDAAHVMVIAGRYVLPELLVDQPLPFEASAPVDPTRYRPGIGELVVLHEARLRELKHACDSIDVYEERESALASLTAMIQRLREEAQSTLDPGDTVDYVRDELVADEAASRAQRIGAVTSDMLLVWFTRQCTVANNVLDAYTAAFTGGKYPGMLTKWPLGSEDVRRIRETVRRDAQAEADAAGGGVSGGTIMEQHMTRQYAMEQIFEGLGSTGADMDEESMVRAAKQAADELAQEARLWRARAAEAATIPEAIVETSDQLKLRIIGMGKRAELEERLAASGASLAERQKARAALIDEHGQRAFETFTTTQCEAIALLKCRESMYNLIRDMRGTEVSPAEALRHVRETHRLPVQPNVNNNSFDSFVTHMVTMLVTPNKVAPKVQRALIVNFIASRSHATTPDFGSGIPKPNIVNVGVNSSGKSFVLNVVNCVSLPGACRDATSMSTQAFSAGVNTSTSPIPLR